MLKRFICLSLLWPAAIAAQDSLESTERAIAVESPEKPAQSRKPGETPEQYFARLRVEELKEQASKARQQAERDGKVTRKTDGSTVTETWRAIVPPTKRPTKQSELEKEQVTESNAATNASVEDLPAPHAEQMRLQEQYLHWQGKLDKATDVMDREEAQRGVNGSLKLLGTHNAARAAGVDTSGGIDRDEHAQTINGKTVKNEDVDRHVRQLREQAVKDPYSIICDQVKRKLGLLQASLAATKPEPTTNAAAIASSGRRNVLREAEVLRVLRKSEPFTADVLEFDAEVIAEDAAAILAKCPSDVHLNSVRSLGLNEAVLLAQHSGRGWTQSATGRQVFIDGLFLPALDQLSPEVANALGSRSSGTLVLGMAGNLRTISDASAEGLSRYSGRLLKLCVRELSHSAQESLAGCRAELKLEYGPAKLSSARLVRKLCGDVAPTAVGFSLHCSELTADAARALCEAADGEQVSLLEISTLTPEVASILKQHRGRLYIGGDIRKNEANQPSEVTELLNSTRL